MSTPDGSPDPLLSSAFSERMDALIAEFADGLLHSGFVPVNWTLIIGGQEPSGEESVCAHVPRDGQAFYVTLGLVQYTKARLDGHAQEGTRRDE